MRRRLAQVLRERLGRPKEAVVHEKRILELDPSDGPTVERVAHSIGSSDPDDAIAYHRRLVVESPDQVESYRALRSLFLANDDRDAAFCAEAVLVGLGAATEEEDYFYRQRRATHGGRIVGTLSRLELTLLCPEREDFVVRVFRTIDALVPRMFPVDIEGYGIDADEREEGPLSTVTEESRALFGVGQAHSYLVSPRLGPAVEIEDEEVYLLLPRTLSNAPSREQHFVTAALLSRAALGGVATDPRRLTAFTDSQLEHLVIAALALGDAGNAPDVETAVYLDMRMRLQACLGHLSLSRLEALATEGHGPLGPRTGANLRGAMNRAAGRAAMLCTGDPALAIACGRLHRGMFCAAEDDPAHVGGGDVLDALPADFRHALAFAVSDTHIKLRQRLLEAHDVG